MNTMHPVKKLIIERLKNNSLPLKRKDEFKLGLVIEGGGMRGIVSAGMLVAIEHFGFRNCFDLIIGSSAGAINGAYFLSDQTENTLATYYENLNNNKFIQHAAKAIINLLRNRPILSLDYLYNHVLANEKKLNIDMVLNSKIPLKIVASSITKRKAVILENFKNKHQLIQSLWGSTSIPIVTGPPLKFNNDHYWDSFMYEAIPTRTAISLGCTHVLVLRTKPETDTEDKKLSFLEKNVICRHLKVHYGQIFVRDYCRSVIDYCKTLTKLNEAHSDHTSSPFIYSIKPHKGRKLVGQFEKNKKTLITGAKDGIHAVIENFLNDHPNYEEIKDTITIDQNHYILKSQKI